MQVENQTDFIARLSRDGRRLYVNANYPKLVGKTEAEVLSTECSPEIHPEDMAMVAQEWAKTLSLLRALMTPPRQAAPCLPLHVLATLCAVLVFGLSILNQSVGHRLGLWSAWTRA